MENMIFVTAESWVSIVHSYFHI